MKLLLHVCCAPCSIYPLKILKHEAHEITACFYNPNIHPFREYQKRLDTFKDFSMQQNLEVIWPESYDLEAFLRNIVYREADRCRFCYSMRLNYTARIAKNKAFDGFTSTLLYSRYQQHDLIRGIGESLAKEYGITFHYHDFREGWSEGIRLSKEMGMYRQSYCGCLYSEKERYQR